MAKRIVITGAASGIGRALAESYLKAGESVAALDLNIEGLKDLAGAHPFQVDVSNQAQFTEVGRKVLSEFGKPDLWYNNAGIAKLGAFEKVSSQDFDRVMAVNFNGVVYGTRIAMSVMSEPSRGMIVNIASMAGEVIAPFMSSYVASKHAVVGFTRALRVEKEQEQSPLKVVLVCPGFVKTPIMDEQGGLGLPPRFQWMVDDATSVACEIIEGVARGDAEIFPTLNGRVLRRLNWIAPELTKKSLRLATARNWKELLGLDPIRR